MKEIEIQAIQEICDKTNTFIYEDFFMLPQKRLDPEELEWLLLGWLNSKDVLIAMYGTEEYGWYRGYNEWGKVDENSDDLTRLRLPAWQYHYNQQAGFTVSERIEYWRKNKK